MKLFHDSCERSQQLIEDYNALILKSENLIEQSREIIHESGRVKERATLTDHLLFRLQKIHPSQP
jgi:hypothetical protein